MKGSFKSMKLKHILFVTAFVLAACSTFHPSTGLPTGGVLPENTPTSSLPQPGVTVTHAPDTRQTADEFLAAWKAEDYAKMYSFLTSVSKDARSEIDFANLYKDTADNLTLDKIDYSVLSVLTNPASAQVNYKVDFKTIMFGVLSREMVMNLNLEKGEWRVQWEDGMIMPELRGGNRLALDSTAPGRANIYDNRNDAIVAQADAVALGIVPGEIVPDQESTLLDELANLTDNSPDNIRSLYKNAGADWYIPVGEASADAVQKRYNVLSGLGGLRMTPFRSRYYYAGGIAPQATGYVLSIPAEESEQYKRRGYQGNEKIGYSGLEKWGESYLAGSHGASLYVVDSQGIRVTRLAQVEAQPAQSIYTTVDQNLQLAAQKSLVGFRGAVVVLERDTGRVLAMASSPGYDPNLFEPANQNSVLLNQLLQDTEQPLLNRAAQGLYPLGSVFKIITMAAALESGLYTKDYTYDCGYYFTELPGDPLTDWTLEFKANPSGKLTLPEGLMRSCNPFFYHIGLGLFRQNRPNDVANMARGFGLGSDTGIGQVAEASGNVENPVDDGAAVQQAIGQGTLQVTPLQVADFIAAVGNGGTLYRPQLVEKISTPDGTPSFTFKPEVRGKLPVSAENLQIIEDAMRSVVANPRGTAYYTFTGFSIPVYGKTGTAQNPGEKPHAWFGGYTQVNNPNKPDIAAVVLVENAGEGSEWAAPIFRRMIEVYFYGKAERKFPWETQPWVTKTPTPLVTDTPSVPTNTPQP